MTATPPPSVELINAATITPKPVNWLWQGWIACGKTHILGGAPGAGKTTIALSLASIASRGGTWPDGSCCPIKARVVMWSGEDDPADTLVPRLTAAGADLSRIFFVGATTEKGETRSFDPAEDIEPLHQAIKRAGGVELIIVDPVVSAVTGDSHKNTEVRRALQPLVDLASDLGAVLIGITHFSKGTSGREPVERLSGSLAFGALARVVMMAAKRQPNDSDGEGERIFCRAKSNLGPDEGGFTYEMIQTTLDTAPELLASVVRWLKPIDGTAREILAEAEAIENMDGSTTGEVETFLQNFLAEGAKTVREVRSAAAAHGFAWRTIERAKRSLNIEAVRVGFGQKGRWKWQFLQTPPNTAKYSEQESVAGYGGLCEG